MNPLKKLASDTALYGLGSIVGRLLNYLLVPFYTNLLLPAEYGTITEWYAYAAFLQSLYAYGMEAAYFRFAAQQAKYFHAAASTLLVTTALFSGGLMLAATPLTQWLSHPGAERYVYYFAAILAVDTALVIPFAQLRVQKRAQRFASIKLLQVALNILLNVVWLCQPASWHWYTPAHRIDCVFIANLVANASSLPLFASAWRQLQPCLPWRQLRTMLVYALPIFLMELAGKVNMISSRATLRHWLPPHFYPGYSNEAILGIFGACYKLGVFMLLGIQAFRYAAEPFFFEHAQDRNAPTLYASVMQKFVIVACFLLFGISANLDLIGHLLLRQAAYRAALPIVPFLLLAYLLLGVYYNLSVWFKLQHKTYYGALLSSTGATITLTLNALLIPRLGYWGSVWASLVSYTTMCLLCYYLGQKHYPIPYRVGHGIAYVVGTMALILSVRQIPYASPAQAIISNALLTLGFGAGLYCRARRD